MGLELELKQPLLTDFPLGELREFFRGRGKKGYLADQVYNWLYQNFQFSMEEWHNISPADREFMGEQLTLALPKIVWQGKSKDGTKKFLLQMLDGKTVETVVIPGKGRLTLCLSSQVGCAIGCTFCHTGTQGLTRHLRAGEIVGQFLTVQKWLKENEGEDSRLTNMVYMGMGEPLHNFAAVKAATEIFMEPRGIAFGQRRITLSTSGLVPQIEKLEDFPPVNVAISLHAAHDDIRTELMPINKRYDLKRLFQAIKSIPLKAHRRITYEYLLIDGLNNRPEDIAALGQLLPRKESKVNLIPFNEYPESTFKRPSRKNILWFQEELSRHGFTCTVRQTMGDDILAACGQLKTFVQSSTC